jgi:iron complex outermembrane receptor protein
MKRLWWSWGLLVWLGMIPSGWAQESLPAELALFTKEELVITPTRLEQEISKSPSATTVITGEQIRRSGLLHLPDILRRVPGVDVASNTASQSEVNIRGVNIEQLSPRTLVLVDGRTVFINVHGFTFWETIPLVLEDIERIEVVRGPVEALYRSPALSGVINIITKDPREINSTEVSQVYGNLHTRYVTLLHGQTVNEQLAYKLSGGWKEWNNFEGTDRDGVDSAIFNAALSYQLDNESLVQFSGGLTDGDADVFLGPTLGIANFDHRTEFAKIDFSHETLKLQGFWNRQDGPAFSPSNQPALKASNVDVDILINTFDLEGQHSFDVGERNTVLWGGGVRFEAADASAFPLSDSYRSEATWTLFLQDEIRLLEPLTGFATVRVDRHPLTDFNISYRASLLYRLLKHHMLFTTIGRTFRNPTLTESRLDLTAPTTTPGVSIRGLGTEDLSPEVMHSYEVGYRALFQDRLKAEATLFFYDLHDPMAAIAGRPPPVIVPAPTLNRGVVYAVGCELGSEVFVTPWLTAFANYTFQDLEREDNVLENDLSPQHKINTGFSFTWKQRAHTYFLDLFSHFVDTADVPAGGPTVHPYTLINGRIAYGYEDWAEVSVAAYNLGHDFHKEVPAGQELGTRVVAKTTLKF